MKIYLIIEKNKIDVTGKLSNKPNVGEIIIRNGKKYRVTEEKIIYDLDNDRMEIFIEEVPA